MPTNALSLPSEVPWERICVSEDMMDPSACDSDRPAKWQSSLAVFKYVPEEDYQTYPGRKITYLKVSCTIAGYQPKNEEIQGNINWNGVDTTIVEDVDEFLESYRPCNEAIVQITVAPSSGERIPLDQYPYIMDFQPKKRELYEVATDTNERMSRSLESLNIRKSAGTTKSLEVLDIDQGFSVGASAQYAGVGGSGQYSQQGQWGTKNIGGEESGLARTTDESRERRETVSHTTQLTQLYHLLDSYHLGTNRVVFLIQPRPHVLQPPSGFVRGPRPIEGLQEFFLVVNQPEDQQDFCVAVRLDTGHLTIVPMMDFDRSKTDTDTCSASSTSPSAEDADKQAAGSTFSLFGLPVTALSVKYNCFTKTEVKTKTYRSPFADYKIDISRQGGFSTLPTSGASGAATSSVSVTPDGEILTIRCQATGSACFKGAFLETIPPAVDPTLFAVFLVAPGTINATASSVTRDVRIFLISREKVIKTGDQQVFFITTRGLCCCPEQTMPPIFAKEGVVYSTLSTIPSASNIVGTTTTPSTSTGTTPSGTGSTPSTQQPAVLTQELRREGMMTVEEASALHEVMRGEMLRSLVSRRRTAPMSLLETALFSDLLLPRLTQNPSSRQMLRQSCEGSVSEEVAYKLAEVFGKEVKDISRRELLEIRTPHLARLLGLNEPAVNRLKAELLGVPLKPQETSAQTEQRPNQSAQGISEED
jgi:hypothetical protein